MLVHDCIYLTVHWCVLMSESAVLVCVMVCGRAFLEDLAHGPGAVSCPVRHHDSGQHVPRRLRLQERQIRPQAQVRIKVYVSYVYV